MLNKSSFTSGIRYAYQIPVLVLFFSLGPRTANVQGINYEFPVVVQKEAKGIVTDEDGVPLKGVIVIISKSFVHTTTDKDGRFVVRNIPEGASLTFMLRGYRTCILPPLIVSGTSLKIKMLKDPGYTEPADTSGTCSEK